MRPKLLETLISSINSLPGIGKKQAERIAYFIIKEDSWVSEELEGSLRTARSNLFNCSICGNITDEDVCNICLSKDREKKLVIVESSIDIYKFEESDVIKPYYHVLNGLINIRNNIDLSKLNISTLVERAKKYKEVIIALSPNLEGIVTANYIRELLTAHTKVSQLAQGIPLGAAMEYVDQVTLKAALDNRKEVK
ncbi:MAG: recombination protein RecR [Mycoplasmataceae bacterium]|nr:recombination protein RecR [Mycoplasmataceae bacterium]